MGRPRSQNGEADGLANFAIDAKASGLYLNPGLSHKNLSEFRLLCWSDGAFRASSQVGSFAWVVRRATPPHEVVLYGFKECTAAPDALWAEAQGVRTVVLSILFLVKSAGGWGREGLQGLLGIPVHAEELNPCWAYRPGT